MIVPIDLLKPIIGDLVAYGRTHRPPRPWLGMYAMESRGGIVVAGLVQGGPAHQAGVELGDLVLEVERAPVSDMVAMFRRVWALGDAGTEIPLSLARDGDPVHVRIRSASRTDYLKAPRLH